MVGRPLCTTHTPAVARTPKPSVEIRVDHLHWCCSEVTLKTQKAEHEACQTGNMSSDPEAETVNTLAAAAPSNRPPITASRKLKLVDLALTHEPSCQHRVHKLGRGSQQKRWLRHCPSASVGERRGPRHVVEEAGCARWVVIDVDVNVNVDVGHCSGVAGMHIRCRKSNFETLLLWGCSNRANPPVGRRTWRLTSGTGVPASSQHIS